MLTEKYLTKYIQSLQCKGDRLFRSLSESDQKEYKKVNKQIEFAHTILEIVRQVREDRLRRELDETEKLLSLIQSPDRVDLWKENNKTEWQGCKKESEILAKYEKIMRVKDHKRHIKHAKTALGILPLAS